MIPQEGGASNMGRLIVESGILLYKKWFTQKFTSSQGNEHNNILVTNSCQEFDANKHTAA